MSELLPCPFCGKKVYIGLYGGEPDYFWMVHGGMHYDECKCRLFMESCKFELEDESKVDYDKYAMKVRGGLVRRWNSRAKAIATTLGSEFNPDGLPVGLTISDDNNLLNWRGENYVRQSSLCGGKLRAEQVRKTVEKHWHDLPAEYDMPEATALPEYSYDWQAIADELNSRVKPPCEGGYCPLCGAEVIDK